MADKQYSAEEIQAMKQANAHGFVDFVTTHGAPDKDGNLQPVTTEQAVGMYRKAASAQEAFQVKVAKVTETIREHLKATPAPAAA